MAQKRKIESSLSHSPQNSLDPYHSFLQSLVGQEVQVYRGGPESKKGILLDVQSDYITLQVSGPGPQQGTIVYYRTEHVQSISENTKSNSMPKFQSEGHVESEFHKAHCFEDLLESLLGSKVQINLGGPESRKGILLHISGNYVAVLTEDDGVVFFNVHHIKSISEQKKDQKSSGKSSHHNIPDYIRANDFHELFGQMSHKWVSINRGGPEALEGVLVQGIGGHYTLVNNDEVLRINPYHIKSISCGPKGSMKQNKKSEEKNENENNEESCEKQESSSEENKGSGKRSGKSSGKSSCKSSGKSSGKSSCKSSGNFRRERVIKTIDYIWKTR